MVQKKICQVAKLCENFLWANEQFPKFDHLLSLQNTPTHALLLCSTQSLIGQPPEEQSFKLKTFSLLIRATPRLSVTPHFPRGALLCQGYNEGRFVIMSERAGLSYGYCVPLWWAVKLSVSLHAFRSLESSTITKQFNSAQHLRGVPLVNIRLIGKGWTAFSCFKTCFALR